MKKEIADALESFAYMSFSRKVGNGGIGYVDWMEFVADELGGFVGYISLAEHAEPYRCAVAIGDSEEDAEPTAYVGVPDIVAKSIDKVISEKEYSDGLILFEIMEFLRKFMKKENVMACHIMGEDISLDYTNNRFLVEENGLLHVFFHNGQQLVGKIADANSVVMSITPEGQVRATNGVKGAIEEFLKETYDPIDPERSFSRPTKDMKMSGDLRRRILKQTAGFLNGPIPQGFIACKSEDEDVAFIYSSDDMAPVDVVVLTPTSVQFLSGEKLVLQTESSLNDEISSWITGAKISIFHLHGATKELSLSAAKIKVKV